MEKYIKKYLKYRKKIIAFQYVDWLINWDQKTQAPLKSANFRAEQVEILSEMYFDLRRNKEFLETVDYLYKNSHKIEDEILRKDVKKINRDLRVIRFVPIDEYIDYQVDLAQSTKIWQEAREMDDFNHFVPILQKIVDYNKRLIKYFETDDIKGYDVLLDIYEPGTNMEFYDKFYEDLKNELVPFVMEVTIGRKPQFNRKLTTREYLISKQKEFSKYLIKTFGFDLKRGAIRDTIHPFTSGISTDDIRIASDYYYDNFTASIFSVMHQIGNALYDQNNDPKFNGTFLFGSPSYGFSEAQARMYENMIGRSYAFWSRHYKELVALFPKELKGISVVEFYRYINEVKRSKIRAEADELTYPLHIMVRYEIEKDIFNNNLKVKDIPRRWRSLMAKYVGVKPATDLDGALQDIHWALGKFGYFPSYALGSAYAAQIYQAMNKDINIESVVENEHINLINEWLKEKINKYGASLTTEELLINATGEPLNPKYYIEYLKNKFSRLKND
ncbi:carboxypeptidase M32 [Haploplasma axanthum]|uniref:Metal-dependent carboxypeptidase n=1 Tax=Haploplasma axanthum TaxID=29552 RepID=A0A449BEZ8_HAPAX|nr:carboxypeptidase M32 [Haploplasma axanthum]VEU81017.1 Putative metalloprotease ypwA [Haploplasma axanthum]